MIESADIGRILVEIGSLNILGEINAAPLEPITIARFLELVEIATGKQAIFAKNHEQFMDSDFLLEHDRCINSNLLLTLGIEANPIENWLGRLVSDSHSQLS